MDQSRGVQVSCRLRDLSDSEIAAGRQACVQADAEARTVSVQSSLQPWSFDAVFVGSASQERVFNAVGRPFVSRVLSGYNCTILTYGQTGSGKTYTAIGQSTSDSEGLAPRAMRQFLCEMQQIDQTQFAVCLTASFIEVYQERLRDLLLPQNKRKLRIRERKDEGVWVDGASEIEVSSEALGCEVLARGMTQRATGATLMNADSSRSHSVFTLLFTSRDRRSHAQLKGRLCIVDLAGSEKTSKTAASGQRLDEAKHINRVRGRPLDRASGTWLVLYLAASVVSLGIGQRDQRSHGRHIQVHSVSRQQTHTAASELTGRQRAHASAAHMFQQRPPRRRDAVHAPLWCESEASAQSATGQSDCHSHECD